MIILCDKVWCERHLVDDKNMTEWLTPDISEHPWCYLPLCKCYAVQSAKDKNQFTLNLFGIYWSLTVIQKHTYDGDDEIAYTVTGDQGDHLIDKTLVKLSLVMS